LEKSSLIRVRHRHLGRHLGDAEFGDLVLAEVSLSWMALTNFAHLNANRFGKP